MATLAILYCFQMYIRPEVLPCTAHLDGFTMLNALAIRCVNVNFGAVNMSEFADCNRQHMSRCNI